MARPRKAIPSYVRHRENARAVWTDEHGERHFVALPGAFGSKESRDAFGRLLLEQEVTPKPAAVAPRDRGGLLLVEVLDAYHTHAGQHYRDHAGRHTSGFSAVKQVVKALLNSYGDEPAAEFGPLKLKAVRQGWVAAKLSRTECNRRTRIVKQMFKWAASEELVPASVFVALSTVAGLQKGRTTAREPVKVKPVADELVKASLPFLNRHVRGLIEFQRLTGCRPGEACALRMVDVDQSGDVWLYRPSHHKTEHHGRERVIAVGPKAQAALAEFIGEDPEAFVFSASAAVEEARAARTADRKTPKYASHMKRNKNKRVKNPKRAAGEAYTAHSFAVAVTRACDRANPLPEELARRKGEKQKEWKARLSGSERQKVRDWYGKYRWHPNQLRHTYGTLVRKSHGLEAAQVMLGHAKADVTQVYAEKNESLAVKIAAEVG